MKKDPAMRRKLPARISANRLLMTEPLVEVVDNRRVLIENHQGMIAYGGEGILVKVRCGSICVTGTKMLLACMTREKLVIVGNIHSVRLIRGGSQ